jgi:hypothetical protein
MDNVEPAATPLLNEILFTDDAAEMPERLFFIVALVMAILFAGVGTLLIYVGLYTGQMLGRAPFSATAEAPAATATIETVELDGTTAPSLFLDR